MSDIGLAKAKAVIPMYDELIKQLRETSVDFGESDHISVMMIEAANAIDELSNIQIAPEKIIQTMWIPVTERLPEDEVLCINDRQFYLVGLLYCDDVGNYICETDGEIMYDVTHWMPLPMPPKDGET